MNELLARYVNRMTQRIQQLGMAVELGKEVPYGRQLLIKDESGQMTIVTLYVGKKGEQAVLGGKDSPLRRRIAAILLPGAAAIATADVKSEKATHAEPSLAYQWPVQPLWSGSDESGKGDVFGPLVVAAVLVTRSQAEALTALGAKDSKQLSDKQIAVLAEQIKATVTAYQIVSLSPLAYNRLYEAMRAERKNLNDLLAWCHAKALSDLLAEQAFSFAVIDRFCVRDLITPRIKGKPSDFSSLQIPKGERDPAVAAASILARDRYVSEMDLLTQTAGVCLPKGASAGVKECAGRLLKHIGQEELRKYVKWHFKTIQELLE